MPQKPRIEFARTTLDALLAEGAEDLFAANFEEVEPYHEAFPLKPDYAQFAEREKLGALFLLAAHAGDGLVGYDVLHLVPHIRYMTTPYAFGEIIYLTPEYRTGWNGYRLLKTSDALLKESGVKRINRGVQLHMRIGARGGTVGDLLVRLGYKHTENVFTRMF